MASSLRHFAGPSCFTASASSAATSSSGTICFLRRYTPNFCTFAALRPIRPSAFSAVNPLASPAELERQHQIRHEGDPPAPSPASAAPAALRVGIVGFGNFGQFIAGGIQRQGHAVLAASRSDYSAYCADHGIPFFRSVDALCKERPDVLLICSSILSTESVVRAIPFHKLRPDTIVADVLSVKQFPRNLLLEVNMRLQSQINSAL
jgi:arogenate dehydrogenase (NADP+)